MKPLLIIRRSQLLPQMNYLCQLVTVCQIGNKPAPIPISIGSDELGTQLQTLDTNPERIILKAPVTKGNIVEKYDYMGAILAATGHKKFFNREGKPVKFPSELDIYLPPFSRLIRRKIVETDLAHNILALSPSPESEKRLVGLLSDHYEVMFID